MEKCIITDYRLLLQSASGWFNSKSFPQLFGFSLVHDSPLSASCQVVEEDGIPGSLHHVIPQKKLVCEGRHP